MALHWPHTSAFVLQLPADADPGAGPFAGRVEHVATGRAAPFHTVEELRAFVAQMLVAVRAGDPATGQDPASGQA